MSDDDTTAHLHEDAGDATRPQSDRPFDRADKPWTTGTIIESKFEIIDRLGTGGMSEVFVARDLDLGRRVALKALRLPEKLSQIGFVEWIQLFRHGAASNARLNHPNIVSCYQFGVNGSVPFMVLEFVEGRSLAERLDDGPLPADEAIEVARQLAAAVEYAHARGIIHRDIKPSNVMIRDDGMVKLLDFGVALMQLDPETAAESFGRGIDAVRELLGETQWIAGTPRFMAPEALRGHSQDARVDVWSFGLTVYEMLSGERLFDDVTQVESETSPQWRFPDNTPGPLAELIRACVSFDRDDRPSTFFDIGARLDLVHPSDDVAPSSLPAVDQVPVYRDAFIGRADELRHIGEWFDSDAPILTLTGPGGVGKTRTAVEWVFRAPDRKAATLFIDLSNASDASEVDRTVAEASGIPLSRGDLRQTIVWGLATRPELLLVLDNCEQVHSAVSALADDLCRRSETAKIVVTSREPLGLPSERTLRVSALTMSTDDDEALSEAARLFVERAKAADPNWHVGDEREPLENLVRELDGLPLAIELAAPRVSILPPSRLLERMNERFALLRSRDREAPDRQGTLEGTLRWSWDLLDPAERAALCQLSRFRAPFDIDALEAVVDVPGTPPFELAQQLVTKSLVRFDPLEARFSMFRAVSHFGRLRTEELSTSETGPLDLPDWNNAVDAAFVAYFARFGERDHLRDLARSNRFRELARNQKNLSWALKLSRRQSNDVASAKIVCALMALFDAYGPYEPGLDLVSTAIALEVPDEMGCRLELAIGALHKRVGDFAQCRDWWERGLERAIRIDDEDLQGSLLLRLGQVFDRLGDLDSAAERIRESLALAQTLEDRVLERDCLGNLGNIAIDRSEFDEAQDYFLRAIRLSRELGDERGRGVWICNLGVVEFYRQDYESAASYYSDARDIARATDDRASEALCGSNLADCWLLLGQIDRAREGYAQAMKQATRLGDRFQVSICDGKLGQLEFACDNLSDAKRHLKIACSASRELGNVYFEGAWRESLAKVYLKTGEVSRAVIELGEAVAIAERQENAPLTARRRGWLGACHLKQGDTSSALALLEQAIDGITTDDGPELRAAWWAYFGLACLDSNRRDPAVEALVTAERIRDETSDAIARAIELPEDPVEMLRVALA